MSTKRKGHLHGRNVLVVEDEYLIAADMCRVMQQQGASIIGPFGCLDEVCFKPHDVDLALLDINLRGKRVYSLARQLKDAMIPFVFVTGYDQSVLPLDLQHAPLLAKPVPDALLVQTLHQLEISYY